MSDFLKLLLSLSLSGTAVALALLFLQTLLHDIFSKGWRYYIWLVVFVRLLLPITLPVNPVGELFNNPPNATAEAALSPQHVAEIPALTKAGVTPAVNTPALSAPQSKIPASTVLFIVWSVAALVLLVRKGTQYQSFTRYMHAGSIPISDPALLNRYADVSSFAKVTRPPELRTSTLISTPMLVGIRKPTIVLPVSIEEDTLDKVLLHELLHHKRHDILYKWFAQLLLCLHWFNPIIWFAVRALEQDCELACDECALRMMQLEDRRSYGNALLQAVQTEDGYHSEVASLALSENAKQLKERLELIMTFRTRTRAEKLLTACLTSALCVGSIAIGAYAAETPSASAVIPAKPKSVSSSSTPQPNKADASTPEGTLELAMQSIKSLDIDALCRYSNNQKQTKSQALFSNSTRWNDPTPVMFGGKNPKQDALFQQMVRSLAWKMDSPVVSGDTAKVTLTVTNRDFSGVMAQLISQAFFDAVSEQASFPHDPESGDMVQLAKAVPDSKTIALSITAELHKTGDVWQLQITEQLVNAVCGNLLEGAESKESKAIIEAAEKKLQEYLEQQIESSIDLDAIKRDMETAHKEIQIAMEEAQIEQEKTFQRIQELSVPKGPSR